MYLKPSWQKEKLFPEHKSPLPSALCHLPFHCCKMANMRARIENQVLFLHHEDLPEFKKNGSVVRNSYFWALRSIAGRASRYRDWEYEPEVWLALSRMLLSFAESGYLGYRETMLEFPQSQETIPDLLRDVSTWE